MEIDKVRGSVKSYLQSTMNNSVFHISGNIFIQASSWIKRELRDFTIKSPVNNNLRHNIDMSVIFYINKIQMRKKI